MRYTKLEFMNRFTDAELATLYTAAKQSIALEVWLAKFNAAVPDADGTSVDCSNINTIGGIWALEAAGILNTGRAAEILGVPVVNGTLAGFTAGIVVRVLAPFNEAYPDSYTVMSVDTASVYLEGTCFAPIYLQKV